MQTDNTRAFGATTVLIGENAGAYPFGNTVVVNGADTTLVIDPALGVDPEAVRADAVLVSHAHEDHTAGLHLLPETPVYVHERDVDAVRSVEALFDGYGLPPGAREVFVEAFEQFNLVDRPDARPVDDGHHFDLGGGVAATVIHLPGHTAGHCGVLIEPDGVFYTADIDLTGFGPYYGDVGSSLREFRESIRRAAEIDARWFATFHQKGVIDGRADFLERLRAYDQVIDTRHQRLLDFLSEPRTLEEIVAHRLVYRPHVEAPHVDTVERRSAELHLADAIEVGEVTVVDGDRYRRS